MVTRISQGNVNLLLASVIFADNAGLNVTSNFLTKEGISITFEGEAAEKLPTMTGAVDSPQPYQMATITMHLNRAIGLAAAFKAQIEANTSVGSVNFIPDTQALPEYEIEQCVLLGTPDFGANGSTAEFVVRMRGIYYVNRDMWNAA